MEELIRVWQELWSWIFLFLNFGTVVSFLKANSTTDQALPPALLLGLEFKDLHFFRTLSANSGNTPSKVNYVLCLLIAECLPAPSDHLPCTVPPAYRSGTWIFAHGDSYYLTTEEDTIPVDHCDLRGLQPSWCGLHLHSCPALPRLSTILLIKSDSSSEIAEAVLSQQKTSLFHECILFLQLKPSEREKNLDQGIFSNQRCLKNGSILLRTMLGHTSQSQMFEVREMSRIPSRSLDTILFPLQICM